MRQISRRAFIRNGTLIMGFTALGAAPALSSALENETLAVRIGLLTDVHYADKPTAGTRHYRESIPKIREAVAKFNGTKADTAIELGDFVDAAADVNAEIGYLKTIEREFARFKGPRHYILGNHCVWSLTKKQFLEHTPAEKSYYSFDKNGFHFVILDGCFRADGVPYGNRNFDWTDTEIPPTEREWLAADLATAKRPTIAFVHQRLDVSNHYGVKSAPAVRRILEESGNVLAVFQGHNHINEHNEIRGIHYCTLAAVVEGSGEVSNAYSLLNVYESGLLQVEGFRQHMDRKFDRA